jgi:hypothetical protein
MDIWRDRELSIGWSFGEDGGRDLKGGDRDGSYLIGKGWVPGDLVVGSGNPNRMLGQMTRTFMI